MGVWNAFRLRIGVEAASSEQKLVFKRMRLSRDVVDSSKTSVDSQEIPLAASALIITFRQLNRHSAGSFYTNYLWTGRR